MSELPEGWEKVRLADLVAKTGEMTDGDWVESKDQDASGSVRLIQLADVGEMAFLDKSNRFMNQEQATRLNCFFLQKDDILISRLGDPLGKTCLYPAHEACAVTVVDVCVMRPGHAYVEPKLIGYFLNSPSMRAEIEKLASGTTRKRITGKKVKDLSFLLPPLNEQRRIVEKIEELFSQIDAGEAALKKAQALIKKFHFSIYEKLLSAKRSQSSLVKLGSVVSVKSGFAFKSVDYTKTGIALVRISSIQGGAVDLLSDPVYLPNDYYDEYKNFQIKKGDILIAMSGATTGKVGVFKNDTPALLNQRVGKFTICDKSKISQEFLEVLIPSLSKEILRLSYGGAQPNISGAKIENINIHLPNRNQQRAIAQKISAAMSETNHIQQQIDSYRRQIQNFKSAILKAAFSGQLVPQDPNDEPASVLLERIKAERKASDGNKLTKQAKATKPAATPKKRASK